VLEMKIVTNMESNIGRRRRFSVWLLLEIMMGCVVLQ